MPQLDAIIYLPNWHVERASGGRELTLEASYDGEVHCPSCRSPRVEGNGSSRRRVRHTSVGSRSDFLSFTSRRFRCLSCGRYFRQRFSGLLPYQRATEAFKEEVVEKHHEGIPQSALERMLSLGHATIERWYRYIQSRWVAEISNNPAPLELGIDEHWYTKKEGFATSLCNLGSHRIYDVVLGRSESSIKDRLKKIRGRGKTRLVSMDLSESYRQIVKRYFPNALIVADRFHVIRLINRKFSFAYKQLEPALLKTRGIRMLLRYHQWNLEGENKERLEKYLYDHPALLAMYDFKQKLCRLLLHKHQTARQCRRLVPQLIAAIRQLKAIPILILNRLGETLENWQEEIARMWRFTKNNAILEGLHTKMELISRRAYGFRNFENYRLRVRALCG